MIRQKLMAHIIRFVLIFSGMVFTGSTLFGQYGTFNAEERKIQQYPVYEDYVDIIIEYNDGKAFTAVIEAIDSLAAVSQQKSEDLQYLFLRNEVANLYSHQSNYIKAYNILKNSMQNFRAMNDTMHIEYFASLRLMRNCVNDINNLPGSDDITERTEEELFQAQFAVLDSINETGEPLRNALADYGMMLYRKGREKEAIEALYRTRNLALEAGDLSSLAVADYSIISKMSESYDLVKTQNEVLKADIALFEAKKSSIPVKLYNAYFHTLVSSNYAKHFDDIDSAIEYAEKAIGILNSLNYAAYNIEAATYGNLANYYGEKGDTLKMWSNANKARDLAATKSMSAYNRAFAYHLISQAVLPYSTDSTLAYISVMDTLPGKKFFTNDISLLKAKAHIQAGNHRQAENLILSVFDDYETIGDCKVPHIAREVEYSTQISFFGLLESLYIGLSEKNGKNTQAIVKIIERQNSLFQKTMAENVYGYEIGGLSREYDDFLDRVLPYMFNLEDNTYYDKTSEIILSSKAIHLNSLMVKKKSHSLLKSDTTHFSRLITSTQEIQTTRNKLAAAILTYEKNIHQLQTELNSQLIDNLMLRFRADEKIKNRDMKVFQDNFSLVSRQDIQQVLDNDEAIIEYFMLDDSWGQILILPDTTLSFYYEGENPANQIRKERYAVMTGRETTGIGETLLGTVMPYLENTKKLVIIPDDNLHYIPFESMRANDQLLIEQFAVSYSYSAALWHNLQESDADSGPKSLLTIAPVFDQDSTESSKNFKSPYWGDRVIEPLPYSREEIMGIEKILQNSLDSLSHLIHTDATKSKVKEDISNYDIVHFASHGIVNEEHPERSGMVLFINDSSRNNTRENIGLFGLGEFFNMNMNADLLVLSSCNSGKGNYISGEGIIALPRGGILAGVPRVMASLWNVHDERTKDFMFLFYKHLAKGISYSEALQQAKLDAIQAGFLTKNWAGFVLIGG